MRRTAHTRRVVLTTSAPSSHACAAAAFGQRGRTLSTSHREAGAAAARGLYAKHANCRRVQECADTREGRRCFARRIDRAARAGVHNRGLRGSVRLHSILTSHSKRPFPEDVDWSPQYSKTRRITRSICFSVYRPLDAPRSRAKTDVRTGLPRRSSPATHAGPTTRTRAGGPITCIGTSSRSRRAAVDGAGTTNCNDLLKCIRIKGSI